MNRTTGVLLGTAAAVGLVAATTPAASAATRADQPAVAVASYQPAPSGAQAVTYDEDLVPVGAWSTVVSVPADGGTRTTLTVAGLEPNREYGAHVHVSPCGPTGDAAGGHFQHEVDPQQPSADPAYANPRNEIWLDFTTDSRGTGRATSHVPWQFGERHGNAVVIHDHRTRTGVGEAGEAGDRLACTTVRF